MAGDIGDKNINLTAVILRYYKDMGSLSIM
jgi:hypothetical protein